MKKNAVAGRTFASWEAFEAHLEGWMREVAEVRIHGTTGEAPVARFTREEAKALQPIASIPPFRTTRELIRHVGSDCTVEVDDNHYSVSWRLIGESVRVTLTEQAVRVHHGAREVAVHAVLSGRRQRAVDPARWRALPAPTAAARQRPPTSEPASAPPAPQTLLRPRR